MIHPIPGPLKYVLEQMSCSGSGRTPRAPAATQTSHTTEASMTLQAGCGSQKPGGEAPSLQPVPWVTPGRGCRIHPATATWFQLHFFVFWGGRELLSPVLAFPVGCWLQEVPDLHHTCRLPQLSIQNWAVQMMGAPFLSMGEVVGNRQKAT